MVTSILRLRVPGEARRRARSGLVCLALTLLLAASRGPLPASAQQATPTPEPTLAAAPTSAPIQVPAATPMVTPATNDWLTVETEHFVVRVEPNDGMDAETFAATYAAFAETAYTEMVSFFGMEAPPDKLTIYAHVDGAAFEQIRKSVQPAPLPGADAIPDPAEPAVHLYLPSFVGKSLREADGALRNAVAFNLVWIASSGNLPIGFAYGMAFYAERPPTPRLARVAATVADVSQRDDGLMSWFELNRVQSVHADPERAASLAYSVVAFLVERYTIRTFQGFLDALNTELDWRAAMEQAYTRKAEDLEQQWRDYLPRWVTGDWRENRVAAFDLEPARELLQQAHYAEAKVLLENSQLLYSDLGDRERVDEVQELLLQCDTGLQAEALMTQAHDALENHTYDRAEALLLQARAQYERLPPEHRPDDLLQIYEQFATLGLGATTSLEEAQQLGRNWGDYPEARAAAVDAGTTFAELGDEEMVARAETVVADLDARQRRLVLMLSALAALTGAWLALWLWARGRSELDWT